MRTLLAVILGATLTQVVQPIPADPVTVDSGRVSGKLLASGVKAYFGIPFAAPPVRELRWRAPQAVTPWKGVYNADRMPAKCIQNLRNSDLNHYFGEEATSEDCLYLNVWAPAGAKSGQKLPVLVFIYGGGFTQGSSAMANYSGESLAKKGVVYASFNYRVGALGFMAHPELTAESPRRASGNWGLLDQVAALQWVNRNIAQFGGDPGKVTILGQSAGSAAVSYLQSSPLARGLIHRAFGMSGSAVGGRGRTASLADGEQGGRRLQEQLKVQSLAEMRRLSAERIYAAQIAPGAPRFQPTIDGSLLPESPTELFASGRQNDIPLLLSLMRDESSNALRTAKTVEEYRAAARQLYGDRAGDFLTLYPVATDADVPPMGAKAAREAGMETTMRGWARVQVKTGKAPVYMSMFSRVHPVRRRRLVLGSRSKDRRRLPYGGNSLLAADTGRLQHVPSDAELDGGRLRSREQALGCAGGVRQERESEYARDVLATLRSGQRADDGVRRLDRRASDEHQGARLPSLGDGHDAAGGGRRNRESPLREIVRRGAGLCRRTSALAGVLAAFVLLQSGTAAKDGSQNATAPRKRLLAWADVRFGYQHDVISHALATIERLGYESGAYDTFIRTDSQPITKSRIVFRTGTGIAFGENFLARNLTDFDAIFFFGVREIDLTPEQRADLMSFIKEDGKGFVAAHSAITAFFSWPEFGEMLGGRFDEHPWNVTDARVLVEDARFPAMTSFPASLVLKDESTTS